MSRSKHPWRQLERNIRMYVKYEYLGYTFEELGREYNITANRAQQIVRNVYYRESHGDEEYIAAIDSFIGNSSVN